MDTINQMVKMHMQDLLEKSPPDMKAMIIILKGDSEEEDSYEAEDESPFSSTGMQPLHQKAFAI